MYFTGEILKPLALLGAPEFRSTPATRCSSALGLPRAGAVVIYGRDRSRMLGGIGYVVGEQLAALAKHLPDYQENIETKLRGSGQARSSSRQETASSDMVDKVTGEARKTAADRPGDWRRSKRFRSSSSPRFRIDSFRERPYLEYLALGGFVLVLVLFMLVGREDLRDRIVGLFGRRQVRLTTRTMEEIGERISRYLATLALVNASFGLVMGSGSP